MLRRTFLGLTAGAGALLLSGGESASAIEKAAAKLAAPADKRRVVPFTAVQISDAFWAPKLKVLRDNTIPHNWNYVQEEMEDNEIAAGWKNIERDSDTPWNQANLHKVLETVAYALPQEANPELEKKLDFLISAIAGAQRPDGYVNALITVRHMTPWANLDGQHDGYVAGHLIEAAVAHYEATGKRTFLDVATKLADHIYRRFITEKHSGVCGHAELELALVRLYRVTGEPRHLELAKNWIERRGHPWPGKSDQDRSYFMDHLPIRQVQEATGHAVRTVFYLNGVADVANESGDETLKAAARRLWENVTQRKMYVVGSVGSQPKDEGFGPNYDLPNRGYNESCASCGMVNFAQAMFLLDGQSESIDVLERVLYNGALHGLSQDGTTSYYRNPLSDENEQRNNIWVCCPPNLSRTVMRLPDYLYAQTARDIYVNLYAAGSAKIAMPSGAVTLTQSTDYPWDGAVKIAVAPARPSSFALRLRVPGWCRDAAFKLNGKAIAKPRLEKGYVVLRRIWQSGDIIEANFPMPVTRVLANPQVEADKGLIALQRGPLVYGFESLDNDDNLDRKLAADAEFRAAAHPDFLGGVTVIESRFADGRRALAIPFYALANRAPAKQIVWIAPDGEIKAPSFAPPALYQQVPA